MTAIMYIAVIARGSIWPIRDDFVEQIDWTLLPRNLWMLLRQIMRYLNITYLCWNGIGRKGARQRNGRTAVPDAWAVLDPSTRHP